jgi:class 3 adenylate cyclase/TolB-like protein
MAPTRRLAAILAADVAGYSRLMGADEEGTLVALKATRRELADPKVKEHRGRIVKTTGDGLLVEFPSVVDAVRSAVEVQREMAARNVVVPEAQRIEFRIGINLGDILIEDDDIFGDGVNIASRLEGLAEPGGICVSRVVRDQVRDKLDFSFEDMGEQQVKNIARPVRTYRIVLTGEVAKAPFGGTAPALPDKPSIAVLPFVNISGDPEQDYFADGMVEEIITALSRIRWLFVIARNSSFTYKGQSVDLKQVGRELGVRYVLEGSVRKVSHRVRIIGQLIDVVTDAHLWADYQLDLHGWADDREQHRGKSIDLARRALGSAPDDPEVLVHAAHVFGYFDEEIDTAIALVDRALVLNTSYASGWYWSGVIRNWVGRPDIALEHFATFLRLSPRERFPFYLTAIGIALFFNRRFEEAASKLQESLQRFPNLGLTCRFLAASYAHMGRLREARDIAEHLRALNFSVLESGTRYRNPEYRELYLSGLRSAAGEAG